MITTRRLFLRNTGVALGAGLLGGSNLLKHTEPPIETFVDHRHWLQYTAGPQIGQWFETGDNSEYFFAQSQAQEDEIYEAVRAAGRDGHELFFCDDDVERAPKYDNRGILVFPHHGGGCDTVPRVNFVCAVLLPETAGHAAFRAIRAKAIEI